jgi:hypothetical protein
VRELSQQFFDDLKNAEGMLRPLLDRVKQDETLMLAIRDGYINIYYRGGNLLRVHEENGCYRSFFDAKYNKGQRVLPNFPEVIRCQSDARSCIEAFPQLKETMDLFFAGHCKPEREFQQLVARENNCSTISNESEYFILDIEFADSDLGARFDMLAMRWLASQRKDGRCCRPALIEMKYGDGALAGSAGILKHLQDADALVSDLDRYSTLVSTMEKRFNQLDELQLLTFNRSKAGVKVELSPDDKPEVILILANHNPRSTKLTTILDDPAIRQYEQSNRFDLRFFVATFAGYGMHRDSVLPLAQFRELLGRPVTR